MFYSFSLLKLECFLQSSYPCYRIFFGVCVMDIKLSFLVSSFPASESSSRSDINHNILDLKHDRMFETSEDLGMGLSEL